MKKMIFLSALMMLGIFAFAQVNIQALIKPGTKLIYAVEANGIKYDFIVTIKALNPALVFDWEMTDRAGNSGTITHTPAAMISANTMYNYFSPGSKTLDDNTLSVWISKTSFTGLTKGSMNVMMKMNTNEGLKKMGMAAGDEEKDEESELHIIVNGEKETVDEKIAQELNAEGRPVAEGAMFSFYNSAKMPVILRMKNGFSIVLKEIKTK
ncbi:MAG: hypothetical protein ABIN74_08390 [Ferruginibacter sp.]